MSLKDRLTRLTGEAPKPSSIDPRQDRIAELRRKLDRALLPREHNTPAGIPAPRRSKTPLEHVVAGEETRTSHGAFFLSRAAMKADDVHGNVRICDAACASMEAATNLTGVRMERNASIEGGLFLDTETTGLMGGTGTFPFLIGLGWFEAGSFATCQLFARDFSEEGAMLEYLSELASDRQFLVTFNGRAYDLNLLAARFILNRCRDTLSAMPHIDLLHPSRRILAHRLENARLSTIETHVLGVERDGDVPGFEIPGRYFDWLRHRDGRAVQDVFTHNRLDVVSLASLLKYLADLVEDSQMKHSHHGDLLKVAGVIYERGDLSKARSMLEALTLSPHADVAASAREALSLVYKKARQWGKAAAIWQDLVASNPHDFFAAVELAKFYEHHARERGKALQLVTRLLDGANGLSHDERASAEHRLRRLLQKASLE
ncbi:MAG: ribonuclease H-like domain-containing protein [Syntrophorhabdales bacterium]|jgi:uncharacterized protein YprB with RNaseH-like and TPR domain